MEKELSSCGLQWTSERARSAHQSLSRDKPEELSVHRCDLYSNASCANTANVVSTASEPPRYLHFPVHRRADLVHTSHLPRYYSRRKSSSVRRYRSATRGMPDGPEFERESPLSHVTNAGILPMTTPSRPVRESQPIFHTNRRRFRYACDTNNGTIYPGTSLTSNLRSDLPVFPATSVASVPITSNSIGNTDISCSYQGHIYDEIRERPDDRRPQVENAETASRSLLCGCTNKITEGTDHSGLLRMLKIQFMWLLGVGILLALYFSYGIYFSSESEVTSRITQDHHSQTFDDRGRVPDWYFTSTVSQWVSVEPPTNNSAVGFWTKATTSKPYDPNNYTAKPTVRPPIELYRVKSGDPRCSNHGRLQNGFCFCEDGWNGLRCDLPVEDCKPSDCTNHGVCRNGICDCSAGWTGKNCKIAVNCEDPSCSNHGRCVEAKCVCSTGYKGRNCEFGDKLTGEYLKNCSNHGIFNLTTGSCVCSDGWTGPNCNKVGCDLNCGKYGNCIKDKCDCKPGWTGNQCNEVVCDSRCSLHGQCKNGTCVCSTGWNGKHCTIVGCLNNCNSNGECKKNEEGEYYCDCYPDWGGTGCMVEKEDYDSCYDGVDNNLDGLKDCQALECCTHQFCRNESTYCMISSDPVHILLKKPAPLWTESFYTRFFFLIEDDNVQKYSKQYKYDENDLWNSLSPWRVANIRSVIWDQNNQPVTSVRVSTEDKRSEFGFSISREDGWFDYMVNGGEIITLVFLRTPFDVKNVNVFVPWNQITTIPYINLEVLADHPNEHRYDYLAIEDKKRYPILHQKSDLCSDHNIDKLHLHITSDWMPNKYGGPVDKKIIYVESQVVQIPIKIPGIDDAYLLYRNSLSEGYVSYLRIQVTGFDIPKSLRRIFIYITVEGLPYSQELEVEQNLIYVFKWDKHNAYKLKVFGITFAKVYVGYEYTTCKDVIWEVRGAKIRGFEHDVLEIGGGWSLNVLHHYHYNEGILQRGDGRSLFMKYELPVAMRVKAGTGVRRDIDCQNCDGLATESRFYSLVDMISGPDGSIYVGDFNTIRRITPDGKIYTLYTFRSANITMAYHLCLSPADNNLYISVASEFRIYRMENFTDLKNISAPVPFAGIGKKCHPQNPKECGDSGPALRAKLNYPKGIAIGHDKTFYFADGSMIRMIQDGIINTIIEPNSNIFGSKCSKTVPVYEAQINWPTKLEVSPLDGSLHFLDDDHLYKLTVDKKVQLIAGTLNKCNKFANQKTSWSTKKKATDYKFDKILSFTINTFGEIFISDKQNIKIIDFNGFISDYAGTSNPNAQTLLINPCYCKTADLNCRCTNMHNEFKISADVRLINATAITCTGDGVVHIADEGSLHIVSLEHYLLHSKSDSRIAVPYPDTNELYHFNRYGRHCRTEDLITREVIYTFDNRCSSSYATLSKLVDKNKNEIIFKKNYANVVTEIVTSQNYKIVINGSKLGKLEVFSQLGKSDHRMEYDSKGLLLSYTGGDDMTKNGSTYMFTYDNLGRVKSVLLPTGERLTMEKSETCDGQIIELDSATPIYQRKGQNSITVEAKALNQYSKLYRISSGSISNKIISYRNRTHIFESGLDEYMTYKDQGAHPMLKLILSYQAEFLPLVHRIQLERGSANNVMVWNHILSTNGAFAVRSVMRKELKVNGLQLLTVDFHTMINKTETICIGNKTLMTISYSDRIYLPHIIKIEKFESPIILQYNEYNRITQLTWGKYQASYRYNSLGLLSEKQDVHRKNGTSYTYDDYNRIVKVTLPSGYQYSYEYDRLGGLRRIHLPSGQTHTFSAINLIGSVRLHYSPPWNITPIVDHFSYNGNLLKRILPNRGTRTIYTYRNGLLSQVVSGNDKIDITYTENGLPLWVDFETGVGKKYRMEYWFEHGLLVEQRIDFTNNTNLNNAKFMYEYDSNFRIVHISGRIAGISLEPLIKQYDEQSGMLKAFEKFNVTRMLKDGNVVSYEDDMFTVVRGYNSRGKLKNQSFELSGEILLSETYSYNEDDRINAVVKQRRKLYGGIDSSSLSYEYDEDGQLKTAHLEELIWKFNYDSDGVLRKITYYNDRVLSSVQPEQDNLQPGGSSYDDRGFITRGNEMNYFYDTKGQLTHAYFRGKPAVYFWYDHTGRLIRREDMFQNVTQYFYSDPEHPKRLTHMYSPGTGQMMSLYYDNVDHVVYAETQDAQFYIVTDNCGTPLILVNRNGEYIKQIFRTPFGHIVLDTNPTFYFPIDFYGGIYEPFLELVLQNDGRFYYTVYGIMMTPNLDNLMERAYNPKSLSLYSFNGNDPINAPEIDFYVKDVKGWLKLVGYELESVAPQLNVPSSLSSVLAQETPEYPSLRLLSSNFLNLENHISTSHLTQLSYIRFPVEPKFSKHLAFEPKLDRVQKVFFRSPFKRKGLNIEHKIPYPSSASEPLLGYGIVLSTNDDGRVSVHSTEHSNVIYRDVFTSVFEGTYWLPFCTIVHDIPLGSFSEQYYFVKERSTDADEDNATLHRIGSQLNYTFTIIQDSNYGMVKNVKIYRPDINVILNIRYGATAVEEQRRVCEEMKVIHEQEVWNQEKKALENGMWSQVTWSEEEKKFVTENGFMPGYVMEYYIPIDEYPELADDSSNLHIVRSLQ